MPCHTVTEAQDNEEKRESQNTMEMHKLVLVL